MFVAADNATNLGAFTDGAHFTLPANATVKASLQSAADEIDANAQAIQTEAQRALEDTQGTAPQAQRACPKLATG